MRREALPEQSMTIIATPRLVFVVICLSLLTIGSSARSKGPASTDAASLLMKTETFDGDPGWMGVNHRSAMAHEPRMIRQDFGHSRQTRHAGGKSAGEIGGFVTPAGEPAFYGKIIADASFERPLSASGMLSVGKGGTHLLLGFFHSETVKEWRTPNTIALRINGRGEKFFAYVEYCTSKWRAGGDTTPFPSEIDPQTRRAALAGFPSDTPLHWSLAFDPTGNDGRGVVTATIGDAVAVCELAETHKSDGATFNRFGILNVVKSADSGSEVWLDDVAVNGAGPEEFVDDPKWNGRNHRATYPSRMVRPWFDFGFSDTHFAGGKAKGELGGRIFRGDCRYPDRMACYGDLVGPLTLEKPLRAFGKLALTRGVSDSTTLFGFYNSKDSMRSNNAQDDGVPESVVGIHIEGPSRDGFRFYPVVRAKNGRSIIGRIDDFPLILPNGTTHEWSLDYDPHAAEGRGRVAVSLDGTSGTLELPLGEKPRGTFFDRFGIVTSWIDGNSQDVYWDDVSYTQAQN
jgi:hypothetical protein